LFGFEFEAEAEAEAEAATVTVTAKVTMGADEGLEGWVKYVGWSGGVYVKSGSAVTMTVTVTVTVICGGFLLSGRGDGCHQIVDGDPHSKTPYIDCLCCE